MDSNRPLDFSKKSPLECNIKEEPRSPEATPPLLEPHLDYSPHPEYCVYQGYPPNVPVPPETPLIGYYPPLITLNFAPPQYINQLPNYEYNVNLAPPEYDHSISWNGYSSSSATSASPASSASHVTNPLNLWRPFMDPHFVPGSSRPSRHYNDSVPGPSRYYNDIYDEAARSFGLVPSEATAPSQYVGRTIATGQPSVSSRASSSGYQPSAVQNPERDLLADLFHVDDTVYNNYEYKTFQSNALRKIAKRNGGILTLNKPQMRRDFIRKKGETDEAYRKRRDKNNKAAKLSRDRRKEREIQLAIKISYLKLRRKKVKRLIAQLYK